MKTFTSKAKSSTFSGGGWHHGTAQRAQRPKETPRYGGDRRNRRWIDRSI